MEQILVGLCGLIILMTVFLIHIELEMRSVQERITDLDRVASGDVVDQERSHNQIHRERGAYIAYLHRCMDRTGTKYLSELEWSEKRVLDQVFETSNSRI